MLNYINAQCSSMYIKQGEKIFHFLKNIKIYFNSQNKYLSCITNNGPWNILFFGNSDFSIHSLKKLNTTYREKGLIQRLEIVTINKTNPVFKYAIKHNLKIHFWQPQIKDKEFEIAVVVSFGYLIPSRMIKLFPLGMINVHGSILPRWRGAAPVSHSLINGDTHTGISIMKIMPKKFDIGSVIATKEIEIDSDETCIELSKKLSKIGADLLIDTMSKLPDILNTAIDQPEEGVTYAPKISKEMSFINWNVMTAKNIYNLQRGLNGIQPLRTYFNNEIVKLLNIKIVPENVTVNCNKDKVPGLIVYNKNNQTLYVSCQGNTWITVGTIILPRRKPQSSVQFSSGFILKYKKKDHVFL